MWRVCETCNRTRQAKFADRAERAAVMMIAPSLWVFVPLDGTPERLAYVREWFRKTYEPKAAVWSIEHGSRSTGYHLNIIADHAIAAAPPGVRVYCERLRAPVRAVAAYITKSSQIPPEHDAIGRTTGDLGAWMKLADPLRRSSPLVAATLLQTSIAPEFRPAPPIDGETFQERTARNLSHLYNVNEQLKRTASGDIDD
ncbi:MAG: hypothetical protein ACRCWJ_01995 [Casimicrobium sp.]